ncbi:hypothetical protein [Halobacteriovorax sp. HLS]|uniref:hypothetical protein n=1 Tax=Halobacteriovorax sp. HLS TaxID=2234000 RepID=UPI000FD84E6C|nr:hypothetical protein [Halobacteriovorax sp. HLS]
MNKVAIVVSSVGYHWEELYQAYCVFRESGVAVDFFTPTGIEARPDPVSLTYTGPFSCVGLGISRSIGPETALGQILLGKLSGARPLIELETTSYQAIYLPGGHGCLFDINKNEMLHQKILELYEQGKLLSGVCHATSTFAFVKSNGRSIIQSKKIVSFSEILDRILVTLRLVSKNYLPIPYSNELALIENGANLGVSSKFMAFINPWFYVTDFPFVTGTGPKAARSVAKTLTREM